MDIHEHGSLIAVWSPKSEGATVTALHLAAALSARRETLLLDLNLRRPLLDLLVRDLDLSAHHLDALYPQAHVGALTPEFLRAAARRTPAYPRLHLLGGARRPENAAAYELAPLVQLLTVATRTFPTVVLDLSPDLDTASTEAGLATANVVLVVLRSTLPSIRTYMRQRDLLTRLNLSLASHRLVITSSRPDDPYDARVVARECAVPLAASLPYSSYLDTAISMGQLLPPGRSNNPYLRAVQTLATTIHGGEM